MNHVLICAALALVVLITGRAARPLESENQVIEEDPCDTCLRWSEYNGADEQCPLRRNCHGQ